jgi:hypothetical protein
MPRSQKHTVKLGKKGLKIHGLERETGKGAEEARELSMPRLWSNPAV